MADAVLPRPVVVMGVSGSGKSSVATALAARLGWAFLEGDDLHPPANVEKMEAGRPLSDEDRLPWLAAIAHELAERSASGVVASCSALRRRYRDQLRAAAPRGAYLFLDAPKDVIRRRIQQRRGSFMPASLLDSQFDDLEALEPDELGVRLDATLEVREIVERAINWLASQRE